MQLRCRPRGERLGLDLFGMWRGAPASLTLGVFRVRLVYGHHAHEVLPCTLCI